MRKSAFNDTQQVFLSLSHFVLKLQIAKTSLPQGQKQRTVPSNRGDWMAVLVNAKIDALLEATSRSFYPTLKYLPKKVRGQIGLLYLLARVADTIADSKHGETEFLLNILREYNDVAQGTSSSLPDFTELADIQTNEHEAKLLRNVDDVIAGLEVYSKEDQRLMLECLDIIVSGQILDLERFGTANEGGNISALETDEQMDDYACLLYTSPSPRDRTRSRMPSSA